MSDIKLTEAQQRAYDEICITGTATFNGSSLQPLQTLKYHGLIDFVEKDVENKSKGNIYMTKEYFAEKL